MAAVELEPELAVVKQLPHHVFNRLFASMAKCCSIPDSNLQQLSRMFSPCTHKHAFQGPTYFTWPETALTFWAIPPSDDAWHATQRFMLKTLKPRVYESSETRAAQRELFMVVPLKPLMITSGMFEAWIEKFAEMVGMSAGCVCFGEYFGPQMLSSMTRIQQGRKNASNFPCQYHKDFSMLYLKSAAKRQVEERVRSITGLEFSSESFINVVLHNKRLVSSAECNSQDASKWRAIKQQLPFAAEALVNSNTLSEDARCKIREIITNDMASTGPSLPHTLQETPIHSARSQVWHSLMDDFEVGLHQAPQSAVNVIQDLAFRVPVYEFEWAVHEAPRPAVTETLTEAIVWAAPATE
jgi:hypothetical protein